MITRGKTAINNNIENVNPERLKSVNQKSIFKSATRPVLSSLTNNTVKSKPDDIYSSLDLADDQLTNFKNFVNARFHLRSNAKEEDITGIFREYEGTEYEDVNFAYIQNLEYTLLPVSQQFLDNHKISPRMRYILINWLVKIHEAHHMVAETLYLTIAIMDRYLQYSTIPVTKANFQLLGMTALFIAAKYEETYPPEICDLVACTDYVIDKKDIKTLECTLLNTLGFEIDFPLPISYLRRLTTYLQVDRTTHNLSKYFLELTIQEYDLCWLTGNMRAAISVCLAATVMMKKTNPAEVWDKNLQALTAFTYQELDEFIVTLARVIYRQNSHSEYRAIKTKYATKDVNMKVAALPILNSTYFEKIARLEFDEAGNPV